MDCQLIALPSGQGWCPACDNAQVHLVPLEARRNCQAHPKTQQIKLQVLSAHIKARDVYGKLDGATVDEATQRASICVACPRNYFDNGCKLFGRGCQRMKKWLDAICSKYSDCEHWHKGQE